MEPVPYAALINQRLVIPSERTQYCAVSRSFLQDCLAEFVSQIRVDEPWYLARNEDVRQAIAAGEVAGAREHYARFGYFEHRMPYEVQVQEDWYLQEYPDVEEAVRGGVFQSGQQHFELRGFQEGRVPFPHFRLEQG